MERDRAGAVLIDRRVYLTFSFFLAVFLAILSSASSDCDVQLGAMSQVCDLKHWRQRTLDGSIEHLLPTCCDAVEETFDLLEGESESCICRLLHRDALYFEFSQSDATALIDICPSRSKPTCLFGSRLEVQEQKLSARDKCYIAASAVGMVAALLGFCASAAACYRDMKKSVKPSPTHASPSSMKTTTCSPSSHQGGEGCTTKRLKRSGGSAGSRGQP